MATDWPVATLGEVLVFANGRTSPERMVHSTYPVYGSNGIIGYTDEANSGGDSIVIGRVGSYCGSVYFTREPSWVTDNAICASARNGHDAQFWYYRLASLDLNRWRAGSGQPLLNQSILSQIRVGVPTLPEQRRIAHILGTLDDKIDLNRRMNETLEAMPRALFKSWFVDFDPVRAKAEGRDPGLPLYLADLFPSRLIDSPLGPIPEGWGIASFTDSIEILSGGTPKTSVPAYWGGDIPWFSVVDAPSTTDVWVVTTAKSVTGEGIRNSAAQVLPSGTTILSARGTVGQVALVGTPMAMNQSCYGLRDKRSNLGFYAYFATRSIVEALKQRSHGSVFDTITTATLNEMQVPSVPADLVHAFEAAVRPMLERIRVSRIESAVLAEQRDLLLSRLIAGEEPGGRRVTSTEHELERGVPVHSRS